VRFVGTTDAAGTDKAVYTAGANGSKVAGLVATNAGTAHLLTLAINNGGTRYVLNTVSLTANAGQNGTVLAHRLYVAGSLSGIGNRRQRQPIYA
jgi:hypothetical protein